MHIGISVDNAAIIKANPGCSEEDIKEELCINWLAQLEHKQASETHVIENTVVDQVYCMWVCYVLEVIDSFGIHPR